MKLKIEEGVKTPDRKARGKWLDIFYQMKEGDSILFPSADEANKFMTNIGYHRRTKKLDFTTTRLIEDQGVRVWKVKG